LFPRPKWTALYSIVVLGTALVVAVEMFAAVGSARRALGWGIMVVAALAIAVWVRLNRVSLEAEDWCACAGKRMTIRVIPSTLRPAPNAAPPAAYQSTQDDPEVAERELEVSILTPH
jgi:hypothetical protein